MILQICGALLAAGAAAYAQMPGYGGPGVATRGGQMGNRGTEAVSLRPYINVLGIADNGLTGVGLTENGEIVNPGTLYGVEANMGAYGSHSWKRSQIGLDYQGNYRHYSRNTFYNGSDQILGLSYTTQVNRRTAVQLSTFAGTTSRTTGGTFGNGLLAPQFLGSTVNDIFDNRAYFLNTSGQMTMQVGARNFVSMGGSAFAVRRQSSALVGLNGQMANGGIGRQFGRRMTLGVNYQYFHVDYPRVFGEADSHMLMAQLTRQFARRWELGFGVGAVRTDFVGVRQVAVDPVVAELFGVTTGREAFNAINMSSVFAASLRRGMRRGSFGLNYNRGVNPGNGALLLNRQETIGGNYSYNTGNNWSLSVYSNLNRFSGFGAYNDRLYYFSTSFMATRQLTTDFHFTALLEVRKMNVVSDTFRRVSNRVAIGMTYSPGSIPISFR